MIKCHGHGALYKEGFVSTYGFRDHHGGHGWQQTHLILQAQSRVCKLSWEARVQRLESCLVQTTTIAEHKMVARHHGKKRGRGRWDTDWLIGTKLQNLRLNGRAEL